MSYPGWLDDLRETARCMTLPPMPREGVVPLLRGMPTSYVGAAADRGEIALRGCLILDQPLSDLQCRACGLATERTLGSLEPAPTEVSIVRLIGRDMNLLDRAGITGLLPVPALTRSIW